MRTLSQKGKGGCPDFKPGKVRIIHCQDCKRDFYGPDCYKNHKEPKGQKFRKCLICCKQYTVHPKKPHKCYHGTCRNCNNFVNIYEHQCSIQPVEPLAKRLVDDEDDGNDDENKPPTLTVIGDIQCLIEDDKESSNRRPNPLCFPRRSRECFLCF